MKARLSSSCCNCVIWNATNVFVQKINMSNNFLIPNQNDGKWQQCLSLLWADRHQQLDWVWEIKQNPTQPNQKEPKKPKQTKTKRNETKRNETRRDETRRNETRRDETRRDETRRDETRQDKTKQSKAKQSKANLFLCVTNVIKRYYKNLTTENLRKHKKIPVCNSHLH